MWLCTSPAYDTVHMRSIIIIIDIRLYINSGHLSCSHSHTQSQTDTQVGQACSGPEQVRLTRYHIRSALANFWVDGHSFLCCGTHVLVNTTRATVPALACGETKTQTLFSLDILVFFCFFFVLLLVRRVRRGWGCRTTDYTSSLNFVNLFSAGLVSNSWKKGGVTLTDKNSIFRRLPHALY